MTAFGPVRIRPASLAPGCWFFGTALRQARLTRGWSQLRLAHEAGTTQDRISEIEGGAIPSLETVQRLARALDLSLHFGPYCLDAIEADRVVA